MRSLAARQRPGFEAKQAAAALRLPAGDGGVWLQPPQQHAPSSNEAISHINMLRGIASIAVPRRVYIISIRIIIISILQVLLQL